MNGFDDLLRGTHPLLRGPSAAGVQLEQGAEVPSDQRLAPGETMARLAQRRTAAAARARQLAAQWVDGQLQAGTDLGATSGHTIRIALRPIALAEPTLLSDKHEMLWICVRDELRARGLW